MIDNLKIITLIIDFVGLALLAMFTFFSLRKSKFRTIIQGLIIIGAITFLPYLLKLTFITSIFNNILPFLLLSLVIIFQPEVRRSLNYINHKFKVGQIFTINYHNGINKTDTEHIMQAVTELSRTRIGALIVLENELYTFNGFTSGIRVNADLSALLLMSIFYPNSPLHDGATIIKKNKISMAGVLLPLDHTTKLNPRYGTRHRAALGASNVFSGLCIVVSEETGSVSIAQNGNLRKIINIQELRIILNNYNSNNSLNSKQTYDRKQLESLA